MARFKFRRSQKASPSRCAQAVSWSAALAVIVLITVSAMYASCSSSRQAPAATNAPPPPAAMARHTSDAQPRGAQRVRTEIGFASRRKLIEHYEKHGREFGSITQDEYLRLAQEMRDRAAGGDLLEAKRADGVITRFDRRTGAFLAFNPDLTIRTFFKPNAGENYFRRQARRQPRDEE